MNICQNIYTNKISVVKLYCKCIRGTVKIFFKNFLEKSSL